MKIQTKRLLKSVGKTIGLNRLFLYLYDVLKEPRPAGLIAFKDRARVFGTFEDSFGDRFDLLTGLRDYLKPGWQEMLLPDQAPVLVPPEELNRRLKDWQVLLKEVEGFLNVFSCSLKQKIVVEIGAYDGATAYSLLSAGAEQVIATDVAAYYITQTPGGLVSEAAVVAKNTELNQMRNAYSQIIGNQLVPYFLEDNICHSSIESGIADAVVSWEVLEHLTEPLQGFLQIARILKKGGIAFHEYNPFFSINGGHSLCTLDLLWGHTRLNAADFERYVEEVRPDEKQVALSFYKNNLNRMSLYDLRAYASHAGLNPIAILPWVERNHLALVTSEVLSQAKRAFPSIELMDLISPSVWVILRKD